MNETFQNYAKNPTPENALAEFEKLGQIVEEAKKTNIKLEESITNEYINELFDHLSKYVTGSNIIGAGSGGYIVGWLKNDVSKSTVDISLKDKFPNASVTDMTLYV